MSLSLHAVIDDEVMLGAFHDFVTRYHAEETLMFWLSVEVFKNRNWKAAKFFGMDTDPLPLSKAPTMPQATTPSTKKEIERRKSRKEKKAADMMNVAVSRQRQLDQSAASRMGVSLEQLYVVKEADFIFDNFIKRDGVYWTCLDADTAREVEEQLLEPASIRRNIFDKAQNQAFSGMNDDLMPRFIREVINASMLDPIPEDMKLVCERFDELRKAPTRRKTGVSTALAFMFRRTSTDKDAKVQTISSREQGKLEGKKSARPKSTVASSKEEPTEKPVDALKASDVLRQRTKLAVLGGEGGSVSALGLSRSRLSYGATESPLLGGKSHLNPAKSGMSAKDIRERDIRKRISAPISLEEPRHDSLSRRMDVGIQRSQSDFKILSRNSHMRMKEFGLENASTTGARSTVSKVTFKENDQQSKTEQVNIFLEQHQRKNSV